ncbi:MAG: hypothetical protein GKR89_36855 [Candidatus Latescibacteria bacterium]|nr:hypothetical protein [Candidatus Latescibacterota bacterium]
MRQHTELATAAEHVYRIEMDGTLDGVSTRDPVGYGPYTQTWENNIALRLENIGDQPVVNPWVEINGRGDWRSLESILAGILDESMSEAEKARAIWEFARRHRYHCTTSDDEVKDTVKMLNIYGYTLCWDEAYTVANLWQAAGLKIRRGIPHGHCTTEVYYDDDYHLLDSDEHLLVLLRDNQTIAGEADLARDHDLMKRAHAYGILQGESRSTSEGAASLFVHDGPRTGGRPLIGDHQMDLTLRPGEALLWEWADRGKYHGFGERPPLMANGRLQFTPRLDDTFVRWAVTADNLHSKGTALAPLEPAAPSQLTYRTDSPYVIVGGQLDVELAAAATLEISADGEEWTQVAALNAGKSSTDLDPHFPAAGLAQYRYFLRLSGTAWSLHSLFIESDLQMAPLALPGLQLGTNQIRYTDQTPGPRQVRLTHDWRQRSDIQPPPAPAQPLFPQSGAEVPGTRFTLSWEAVPEAVDYHLELAPEPDLQYVLSPTFEKLISRTPSAGRAEWTIPYEGLLNPDQDYYWRVRSRNEAGLWGTWSPTWHFIAQAPGVVQDVRLETDWAQRALTLHWLPNPQGTAPAHYEVYGSHERGFTASRQPYPVVMGTGLPEETFPANLLATSKDTSLTVVESGGFNKSYYRVVAVDAAGIRSGPSDYAAAPRPFIHSQPPHRAKATQSTQYQVDILRSIGDLRSLSDGPRRYISAFRDGDQVRFLLDEGPAWLHLDEETGLLTMDPALEWVGTHTITIRVQNGQGGTDVQGFDVAVVMP